MTLRAASAPVMTGSVVKRSHSMGSMASGGAISRANTTAIEGAVGVLTGRWAGRSI
jgi:hypothetical protein